MLFYYQINFSPNLSLLRPPSLTPLSLCLHPSPLSSFPTNHLCIFLLTPLFSVPTATPHIFLVPLQPLFLDPSLSTLVSLFFPHPQRLCPSPQLLTSLFLPPTLSMFVPLHPPFTFPSLFPTFYLFILLPPPLTFHPFPPLIYLSFSPQPSPFHPFSLSHLFIHLSPTLTFPPFPPSHLFILLSPTLTFPPSHLFILPSPSLTFPPFSPLSSLHPSLPTLHLSIPFPPLISSSFSSHPSPLHIFPSLIPHLSIIHPSHLASLSLSVSLTPINLYPPLFTFFVLQ